MIDVSLKLHERLTVLRIHLFGVPDFCVTAFRALLHDAALPSLLDLELEIISRSPQSQVFGFRPKLLKFIPFAKDSPELKKGSILAPAIAGALAKLQIGFEDNTTVEDSRTFFEMFGAKPSLLKIEGDGLALRTGRP
jgi:hypothetical protein